MDKTLIESFGASVVGPRHSSNGSANEDAWLRTNGKYGSLIVVCDGLGSRSQARLGARTACFAVRDAVREWSQTEGAPVSYLCHLIEVLWRIKLYPCKAQDAATTCLMALARPNGEWIIGGIGDGLILVKTGEDEPIPYLGLGDRGDDFGNETQALGISRKAWDLKVLSPTGLDRFAILATDGVSDDLNPQKIEEFCKWISAFCGLPALPRWRLLVSDLKNWPTPKHQDDKTVALLKISAQ
jgi:serine/threonine protein phosphatase PrpC